MADFYEEMAEFGVVPVVALDDVKDAVPLAKALCAGGLPVAEITFRTAAAEESIREIAKAFPQMCVGAGTVLNVDQVKRAVEAGAKFIVSPGFSKEIVSYCKENDIPCFPGGVTPTEIMQIIDAGYSIVKFFPASSMGGLKTIKALGAPFTSVKFMPTGGVNADNLREFLESDKIYACGGSWMVKKDLINAGAFDQIEALTKEAVAIVKEVRG